MPNHSDDLALALALADLADSITLERYLAEDLAVETKPDLTHVTEADHAVEREVRKRLDEVHPGDSVLGEEYGHSVNPDAVRRWIIDPIDGTANYVRGVPVWATLLALQEHDELVVGVVSAPALHRRWWAARGLGAYVSDGLAAEPRPITVSGVHELSDAQLSFPGLDHWEEAGALERLIALSRACWRSRGFGDFWSYMLLAEGAVDVVCEPVVSLWDLAAVQVIVEEAGGRFSDLGGARTSDGGDALATNAKLYDAALAVIGR